MNKLMRCLSRECLPQNEALAQIEAAVAVRHYRAAGCEREC